MPTGAADLAAIIKEQYMPTLTRQNEQFDPTADFFEDVSDSANFMPDGESIIEMTQLAGGEDFMAIGEHSFLMDGSNESYARLTVPLRKLHHAFSFTGNVMRNYERTGSIGATLLPEKMKNLERVMRAEQGRMIYGTGRGAIAQVNGALAAAATVIVVDNPGLYTGATGGARYIRPGMKLAIVDLTDTNLLTTVTVLAVNSNGLSFTIPAPGLLVPIGNDSIIYRAQSQGATSLTLGTSKGLEPAGLGLLVSDATTEPIYFGLARATAPQLNSTIIDATAGFTHDLIQRAFDNAQFKASGSNKLDDSIKVICEASVRRAYIAINESLRRYTGEGLKNPDVLTNAGRGGSVQIAGYDSIVSINAPYGKMWIVNTSSLKKVKRNEQILTETGSSMKQLSAAGGRLDAYVTDWICQKAYYNSDPKSSVLITNIPVSQLYIQRF